MLGIYIGLMAVAEALKPGIQLPKAVVLVPAAFSFFIDVLVLTTLAQRLLR